ncbi:hypothetical protein [Tuwongella immobilis]|uniref:Uncharacterized protein n=1 Tax=Tuwongella immobilis TaxID=692036 RepID=A0A6C2YSI6_9BACT|nr:hypothetical protein [Tuwongella immobilis]VIP03842.1 unnamed protein product [Tuwongella immobilis]VTS05051.1 unnamed protein product [Tuwongella immobilis]
MPKRLIQWASLVLFAWWVGGHSTPLLAAEPVATFAIEQAWLKFSLTQDAKPLLDAQIRVIDFNGREFARGEVDASGTGEFPMPRGDQFTVEFTIANKTADLIPVTRVGRELFPTQVMLTFGLAPCCHLPKRGTTPASAPAEVSGTPSEPSSPVGLPIWFQVIGSIGFTVAGAWILLKAMLPVQTPPILEKDSSHVV